MVDATQGGAHTLVLLLVALATDGLIGHLEFFNRLAPGPGALIRGLAGDLGRRLNRPERGQTTLLIRGGLVALLLLGLAGITGLLLAWLSRWLHQGFVFEWAALVACLGARRSWERIRAVRTALGRDGLAAAQKMVTPLTARDVEVFDRHAVARTAIEAGAKAFDQHLVAPAFWYALFGLPGAFLWTAANALDAALGHRSPRYESFGLLAARIDDVLNFLPARIAAVLIVLAAVFVPTAHPLAALRTMIRDARYHPSLNAGWPLAATAGALGLALCGPWRQGEVTVREVWIGHGRARAGSADIARALALYAVAALISVALLAATLLLVLIAA